METKTMTAREAFQAMAKMMRERAETEHLAEFCDAQISKLDNRATKLREKAAERHENDPIREAVRQALTETPQTLDEITAKIGVEDYTIARVRFRLTELVALHEAERHIVTVGGDKPRKVVAFSLPSSCEEA